MSLTLDQYKTIVLELVNKETPTIKGKEADAFRKEVEDEMNSPERKGGIVMIPPD